MRKKMFYIDFFETPCTPVWVAYNQQKKYADESLAGPMQAYTHPPNNKLGILTGINYASPVNLV